MKKIIKTSELILKDYRPEHSLFQIENFIIGSQGGTWAQYRQCLRELSSRHGAVDSKINEIKKDALKLKEIEQSIFSCFHKKAKLKLQHEIKTVHIYKASTKLQYYTNVDVLGSRDLMATFMCCNISYFVFNISENNIV